MITLVTTSGTINLPGDLVWQDEFKWSPVATAVAVTLGGALIVEKSTQLAGRPITLGGISNAAFLTSAQLDELRAAEIAQGDTPMTLTLHDGRAFTVLFFGSGNQPAVDGTQAYPRAGANSTERDALPHWLTLRFIEV
jgi:hypothetical protein